MKTLKLGRRLDAAVAMFRKWSNILPRKKIADFIDNLYDGDLHAKRVLSLANVLYPT